MLSINIYSPGQILRQIIVNTAPLKVPKTDCRLKNKLDEPGDKKTVPVVIIGRILTAVSRRNLTGALQTGPQ